MFPWISVIGSKSTFNEDVILLINMLIDIVQNKRTNYQIYLDYILKESGRIISYRIINLVLIIVIETIKLIKLFMVQPSIKPTNLCQCHRREDFLY